MGLKIRKEESKGGLAERAVFVKVLVRIYVVTPVYLHLINIVFRL
jgi:hypothetical protein